MWGLGIFSGSVISQGTSTKKVNGSIDPKLESGDTM